ncbi:glycoside hydrolase family 43 protein [Anaerocolumna jejuensis]|uniref:glycoside hydrolase family 43 protein n=1 Tax=Anaerocolumna jejuensis TaxID=259063 RepID=UPI003F7C5DAA
MKIKNPILTGFHPDPSIIRVDDTYYIASSTFEWWPGVQIHKSKDLVNWKLMAYPLNETRLLDMTGNPDSGGIWAPDLSYYNGKFYLVYTDVKVTDGSYKDCINYLITSSDIMGPWSDPIVLNTAGFDASLFHDEDGRKYLLNQYWDFRSYHHPFYGIMCTEFSEKKGALIGEPWVIYKGTNDKFTEGPHLYKLNGYYYLFVAQGGTVYAHQERAARSRSLYDDFETQPGEPFLTTLDAPYHPIQKAGHGSLVNTESGEWYFTHLMGRPLHHSDEAIVDPRGWCPLGRETGIQKVVWDKEGWPHIAGGHNGLLEVEGPEHVQEYKWKAAYPEKDDFDHEKLNINFQSLRIPLGEDIVSLKDRPGHLRLYGCQSLASVFKQAHIARRWQAFNFDAEIKVEYYPKTIQQFAGLTCYYNTQNWSCIQITWNETYGRVIDVVSTDLGKTASVYKETPVPIPENSDYVYFKVEVRGISYKYYYSFDNTKWEETPYTFDSARLSDEYIKAVYDAAFTGAFVGMVSVDCLGTKIPADFDYFIYKEFDFESVNGKFL